MSPKTEYIFGVCNNATNFMNVYIWGEETANRGADNMMKHLVVIADNCPGQNKNFCVLKFCCWLVEAGWAGEVTLIFLINITSIVLGVSSIQVLLGKYINPFCTTLQNIELNITIIIGMNLNKKD